jgi:peptidoglycan/xylan/chitin deacetylase (PgdA/CDA1 family)
VADHYQQARVDSMDIETRRARREERRHALRRRRRRLAGLAALIAAVAAAVAVALSASGSPSPARHASTRSAHSSRPPRPTRAPASTVDANAATGPPGSEPVPILMYHVIASPPPGAPFPGLYVPPAEFAEQMRALEHAGWHAVTLDQVEAHWKRGVALGSGRPLVISFDNGYESQYTQALPIMRSLGWVGVENLQLTGLPPSQGGIGQREVRELLAAGWELDTQGFSHADLIVLSATALHHEVAVSRTVLRRRFHVQVNWFCYPSGHYDARVVAAVAAAGYAGSTTVIPGWAHRVDDRYRLHRLRVLGGTSASQLLALIAAARDDPPAPSSYGGA